jgi:hypothetical protein
MRTVQLELNLNFALEESRRLNGAHPGTVAGVGLQNHITNLTIALTAATISNANSQQAAAERRLVDE